ncbi:uncharacterized protein [Hetaerina americana]|uniref:uncharacterized protein n=1 Tax=Hetaerina americana TaxID=62018 RepID=UPI003A7F5429
MWGWQKADSSSSSNNSEGYINYGLSVDPEVSIDCSNDVNVPKISETGPSVDKKDIFQDGKKDQSKSNRRKYRPKTAKSRTNNRVAPKRGSGNQLRMRPATAGQAEEKGNDSEDGNQTENSSDQSTVGWRRDLVPPVPWSTQNIANMNTLLAWDKSDGADDDL